MSEQRYHVFRRFYLPEGGAEVATSGVDYDIQTATDVVAFMRMTWGRTDYWLVPA